MKTRATDEKMQQTITNTGITIKIRKILGLLLFEGFLQSIVVFSNLLMIIEMTTNNRAKKNPDNAIIRKEVVSMLSMQVADSDRETL